MGDDGVRPNMVGNVVYIAADSAKVVSLPMSEPSQFRTVSV